MGILPLIYVSNYILNNHKKFKINFVFLSQLTILIFTIFGRSSGNWMILSIIFLSLYFFLIKLKNLKKNYFNNFLDYNVFIIIFLISFKLLISAYINTGIPSLKSSKHMFWHNLYSGLNSHPNWRSKLDPIYVKNNGGDVGLYKSFENYYSKKPSNQWREGNSVFGYKIDVYENFVKDKYLKFLKENKYFILETYFFYKPKKYFLFLYDLFSKNFNYFFLLNLLFIFGLFLILTNFHIGRNIIILFFLIFSSIPSYLTGFSLWIMGDHIILFVMSLNFVFLKLLFYLRAKIKFYA